MTPQNRPGAPAQPAARGNATQAHASPQKQARALLARNPARMRGRSRVRGTNILSSVLFTHWLRTGDYLTTARRHNTTTSHVIAAIHYELGKKQRNEPRAYQQAMRPDREE